MTGRPAMMDAPVGGAPGGWAAPQSSDAVSRRCGEGVSEIFTRGRSTRAAGGGPDRCTRRILELLARRLGVRQVHAAEPDRWAHRADVGSIEVSAQRPALMFQEPALLPG